MSDFMRVTITLCFVAVVGLAPRASVYDHKVDPNEWNNLAGDPQFADVIASHRKWLPKSE
jgi:hypothetical protein